MTEKGIIIMIEEGYKTLIERKRFLEQKIKGIDKEEMKEIYLSRINILGYISGLYFFFIPLSIVLVCLLNPYKFVEYERIYCLFSVPYVVLGVNICGPICNLMTDVIVSHIFTTEKATTYVNYSRITDEICRIEMEINRLQK